MCSGITASLLTYRFDIGAECPIVQYAAELTRQGKPVHKYLQLHLIYVRTRAWMHLS